MSTEIPSDYGQVVQKLISQGKFQNEQEVVAEGIRLVIARDKLHADIQAGIDQLDRGQSVDADKFYAEERRRIKAIEDQ
ncbi:MAG: hypothetical protein AAF664_18010 [Planctomycetota bacterium]